MTSTWGYDPTPYDDYFQTYGKQYGVDPRALRTIASIESDFNPGAVSPKGARGLMQFMPDTGRDYGLDDTNWNDPEQSIRASAQHYRRLLDKFGGDYEAATASYNWGEGNYAKHGGDYSKVKETREYVERYRKHYGVDPGPGIWDNILDEAPQKNAQRTPARRNQNVQSGSLAAFLREGQSKQPGSVIAGLGEFLKGTVPNLPVGASASTSSFSDFLRQPSGPDGELVRGEDGRRDVPIADGVSGGDGSLLHGPGAEDPLGPGGEGEPSEPYRNPFPIGSRAFFEHAEQAGGLPSIRSGVVEAGAILPGGEVPTGGSWDGSLDVTKPIQFMGRVVSVTDADTFEVEEMGTGYTFPLRLSDVDAAESFGAERTPEGIAAAAWMRDQIPVGSQVVVESDRSVAGEVPTGKYGRPIAKAYVRTADGRTIDLSAPVATGGQTVRDAFLADPEIQGLRGTLKGYGAAAALDPVELGQFASLLGDWVGLNDPDKGALDGKLAEWDAKLTDLQARYVAQGYDPDARTINIPYVGEVTLGEASRALGTSVAYTFGLTAMVGRLLKGTKAGIKTLGVMRQLGGLGDPDAPIKVAKRAAKRLGEIRSVMAKDAARGAADLGKADEIIQRHEAISATIEESISTLESLKPLSEMTAIERLKQFKDLFIHQWSDKFHPFTQLSKLTDESDEALVAAINRVRASGDASRAPLYDAVYRMSRHSDGKYKYAKAAEPLTHHWQGVRSDVFHHSGAYMQYERVVNDLYPRMRARQIALQKAGKSAKQIAKILKKEGVPITTQGQFMHAKNTMARIKDHYTELGMWDDLRKRMHATREWMDEAVLKALVSVDEITELERLKILKEGGSYAAFARLNLDLIERLMGPEAAMEVLKLERNMLRGSDQVAVLGKGLSESAVGRNPLPRIKGSLGPKQGQTAARKAAYLKNPEAYKAGVYEFEATENVARSMDMWQILSTRVPAIQKYVDQQYVKNLMGEMIDEGIKNGDKWMAKTMRRVVRSDDPSTFEKVARGSVGNAFVRNTVNAATGKADKIAYVTFDKALGMALESMSPTQMSLFKGIMTSPIGRKLTAPTRAFRAGTVLGLHFMVRNPVRDQLMAATLTKYGYVPVIDFWRGMGHVLGQSEIYKGVRGGGGTQAGFHAQDLEQMTRNVTDIHKPEGLRAIMKSALNPDEGVSKLGHFLSTIGNPRKVGRAWKNSKQDIIKTVTSPNDSALKRQFKYTGYALRSVSELLEEATRVGAVARGVKRAAKGKGYSFTRSLDEAAGGGVGWAKLAMGRGWKGFGKRFKKANTVPKWEQEAAQEFYKTGKAPFITSDMIDEARNLTLDFNRHGAMGEVFNAFYPFLNAEIQDYSRFVRAMREAPLSTSAKAFAFISLPAIANWYINFDNPDYQKAADIEKELFIHPFGFDNQYSKFGRIPRPIGTISGMYGLSLHKMLDHWAANDPAKIKALEEELWPGKNLRHMRNQFFESASDVTEAMPGPLKAALGVASMGYFPAAGVNALAEQPEDGPLGDPYSIGIPALKYLAQEAREYGATQTLAKYVVPKTPGENIGGRMAPQIASPILKMQGNYDWFFDAPVTPPRLESANMLEKDVWTEQTMPLERIISQAINMISPMKVNPIEAGFLVRAYTGGLGSMLMAGGDQLMTYLGVQPGRPSLPKDASDAPINKAFWSREPWGSNSKPVREMYDAWTNDERVLNSLQHNIQKADAGRVIDIMKEHPEFIPAKLLEKGVAELAQFHKMRRVVMNSYSLPDEERADLLMQIDQNITSYAHQIMMAYNNMKRDPSIAQRLMDGLP